MDFGRSRSFFGVGAEWDFLWPPVLSGSIYRYAPCPAPVFFLEHGDLFIRSTDWKTSHNYDDSESDDSDSDSDSDSGVY